MHSIYLCDKHPLSAENKTTLIIHMKTSKLYSAIYCIFIKNQTQLTNLFRFYEHGTNREQTSHRHKTALSILAQY